MGDSRIQSEPARSAPVSLAHYRDQARVGPDSPAGAGEATVQPPDEWAVPVGVYCLHCGYDLRGLPAGRPCSECGKDVDWAGHLERLALYYRRGASRTLWDMLNFFCVLPHGLWALRDPAGRGWAERRWRAWGIASLMVLVAAALLASGTYVESHRQVWYEREGESTSPATVLRETKKFLGGWGVVSRDRIVGPSSPGPDWVRKTAVRRRLRLSMAGAWQDGKILLTLHSPLLLVAVGMWPMRWLVLWFSVLGRSKANRRWLRERLSPVWLGFAPAVVMTLVGMSVQLSWPMWPEWIPDKAKELVIIWVPNAGLLIPVYLVMRMLSADYTRRLFPNRWVLGYVTLGCMVVAPWTIGQVTYFTLMATTYSVGLPVGRLPSLLPF